MSQRSRPNGPPKTGAGRPEPASVGRFTFIDLFAGIGGFHLALGETGAGGHCVFASEWDRHAQETYRANFPGTDLQGDIRAFTAEEGLTDSQQLRRIRKHIPDHDVLAAGFPCQPFSLAGVSKKNALGRKHGFECETQGTLFFEIEKILRAKEPRAFVLENVKNLTSHDGGRTFDIIMRSLRQMDYAVSAQVIDAKALLPQHRERIFIVGLHRRLGREFSFDDLELPPVADGPKLGSVLHPEDGTEPDPEPRFLGDGGRVLPKYTLTPRLWAYLQAYAAKHRAAGNGFGYGLVGPDSIARTLSARYHKDGSEILVEQAGERPRRLTPRECARLMGFDRPGMERFRIEVSDTQAYRQFGNSVAVPVVERIARALARHLGVGNEAQSRASEAA